MDPNRRPAMMPPASSKKPSGKPGSKDQVVCEPGRHIGCMHAKRAAALGAASGGMDPTKAEKR